MKVPTLQEQLKGQELINRYLATLPKLGPGQSYDLSAIGEYSLPELEQLVQEAESRQPKA